MHHKVKGIVIKESPYGENGKLLTVLTELDGVLLVKAKGARSILASNLKSVQLFACSNMLLYQKNTSYTLVDAELIDDFYALRDNIDSFALASYCCEVAGSVAVRGADNSSNLQLLLNTLYAVSRGMISVKFAKAVFEFRLACILGFTPEISECAGCGSPLETKKAGFLDIEDGVMLCAACKESPEAAGRMIPVSPSVYDALRYISGAKSGRIFSFLIDENALDELAKLSEAYLHLRLDKKYKTLDFLKTII
ncbi:MAG TPA: DNA repair protein RecO [Bacillota bacterium]|nr:DNA repair protein RecO [Bacillota bacterium]HOK69156.1 DNA repair protein RecO [Bacillota bacterium]HPP84921.1 DNA repair protein RecO [Bacillota bacterium]